MTKEKIRFQLKEKRLNLNITEANKNSTIISDRCIDHLKKEKYDAIYSYSHFQNEVNLTKLHQWVLKRNTPLLFPKHTDNGYTFVEIKTLDDLKANKYGIKEPIYNHDSYDMYSKKCYFIPGIGFDKNGNRLGFGKGIYDQLLKNRTTTKIGICYDFQLIDVIPNEEHDVKMNIIITNDKKVML